MKKTITILAAAAVLTAFVAEKFVVVRFTEPQINFHWQNLNAVKQVVSKSSIPHNEAVFVLQTIDSLQKDIQLHATIDSTTLKK